LAATASSRYRQVLHALAICVAADVPVLLWGPPGQGKSSVIESLARGSGRHCEVVIASLRDPSDFAGLPVVSPVDGSVRMAPPAWAVRLCDAAALGQDGVLFFDELSTAVPATQAALLRVITDRVVGETPLPAGTRVVAAANPPEQAADGWDLSAPTANRFCHLEWSLPADVVADGLTLGWPEVPAVDTSGAGAQEGWARTAVAAFLRVRPDLVTVLPRTAVGQGRAYPTPRSWEVVCRLLGVCRSTAAPADVAALLLAGTLGEGAAHELLTFLRDLDLPDPELVLADPQRYLLPTRADGVYAVGVAALVAVERDCTPARWGAYGQLLARLATSGRADMAVALGERWVRLRPEGAVPPPALTGALLRTLRLAGKVPAAPVSA
jgi:AAA domain (dynein-related subfamily)